MSRATERRAGRMHIRCPVCRKRIADTSRVTRVIRFGLVHIGCAAAAKVSRP